MRNEKIKNIILAVLLVLLFIFILVEANKSNKGYEYSDYEAYKLKYKGEVDQINYIKVSDFTMVQKYLSHFVNTCLNDKKEAYELIDPYYKNSQLRTYSAFEKRLDKIMSKVFLEATAVKYDVKHTKSYTLYYVEDAAGNNFVFKEDGIMNYIVYMDMVNTDL